MSLGESAGVVCLEGMLLQQGQSAKPTHDAEQESKVCELRKELAA